MFGVQKELEGLAKPLLERVSGGGSDSAPQSEYIGGDFRCACSSNLLSALPFYALFISAAAIADALASILRLDRAKASLLSLLCKQLTSASWSAKACCARSEAERNERRAMC